MTNMMFVFVHIIFVWSLYTCVNIFGYSFVSVTYLKSVFVLVKFRTCLIFSSHFEIVEKFEKAFEENFQYI